MLAAALAVAALLLGPRPTFEEAWVEPVLPDDLDAYLDRAESRVPALRPGDGRAIVWSDPDAADPTPVAIAYLHGFSADRHELEPMVSELGRELGANVYFARLTGHGRDGDAMAEATAEDWLADAAEAVAIADRIGERVVLMGTSTGGTLALWAASRPEGAERVDALVLVSPNFQPRDRSSRVLLHPWGSRIARMVVGPERCFEPESPEQERHWTTCYPTSALSPMMALVEHVRTRDLASVRSPVLLVYSPDDAIVDPSETDRVMARLTRVDVRRHVVEGADDPSSHVLAGDILSPSSSPDVREAIRSLLVDVLALPGAHRD